MNTELSPRYDSRASFYGKARVRHEKNKVILTSYSTDVAEIDHTKNVPVARVHGTYSNTTLRHIKEFLLQHGFRAVNKAQILKEYGKEDDA